MHRVICSVKAKRTGARGGVGTGVGQCWNGEFFHVWECAGSFFTSGPCEWPHEEMCGYPETESEILHCDLLSSLFATSSRGIPLRVFLHDDFVFAFFFLRGLGTSTLGGERGRGGKSRWFHNFSREIREITHISLLTSLSVSLSRRKSVCVLSLRREDFTWTNLGSTVGGGRVDFAASYQPQDRTFGVDHSGPACSLTQLPLNTFREGPRWPPRARNSGPGRSARHRPSAEIQHAGRNNEYG